MKKGNKNVNLCGKKSQPSEEKSNKNVNLGDKKSETSVKKTKKSKFRWQKLVNLNNQISNFIVKVTKSKYLDQYAGDGLRPKHYHCVEIHQSAAQFDYILHEIGNQVRECQWTWTPLREM